MKPQQCNLNTQETTGIDFHTTASTYHTRKRNFYNHTPLKTVLPQACIQTEKKIRHDKTLYLKSFRLYRQMGGKKNTNQ